MGRDLWRTRYAASPDVLGRRVTLSERRYTVVGVMPSDSDYPAGVEVWVPTHSIPTDGPFGDAARREIDLIARLRAGVTMAEATASLQAVVQHDDDGWGVRGFVANARGFEDAIVGAVRRPLLALLAAVALVLIVACANVANLQLMRTEGRRAELAVHDALGAGRGRLVRQVVLETLILGAAATIIGGAASGGASTASSPRCPPVCRAPTPSPRRRRRRVCHRAAVGDHRPRRDAGGVVRRPADPDGRARSAGRSAPHRRADGARWSSSRWRWPSRSSPPPASLVRGLMQLRALDTGLSEESAAFRRAVAQRRRRRSCPTRAGARRRRRARDGPAWRRDRDASQRVAVRRAGWDVPTSPPTVRTPSPPPPTRP